MRARVVSALLVYRAHMRPQSARLPKRSVALRARVVSALLVHRAHVPAQISDDPGLVVTLRASVVLALLVHRAHVIRQAARLAERSGAVGAQVRFGVRCLQRLGGVPLVRWHGLLARWLSASCQHSDRVLDL